MFWLKRCPRCSGDLFEQVDHYGNFVTCMQCGFSKDIRDKEVDAGAVSLDPVPAPVVPKHEAGKRRRLSHGGRHFSRTFSRANDSQFGAAA